MACYKLYPRSVGRTCIRNLHSKNVAITFRRENINILQGTGKTNNHAHRFHIKCDDHIQR